MGENPTPKGNGAREALTDVERSFGDGETIGLSWADWILAGLWKRGFKVVPLDGTEEA